MNSGLLGIEFRQIEPALGVFTLAALGWNFQGTGVATAVVALIYASLFPNRSATTDHTEIELTSQPQPKFQPCWRRHLRYGSETASEAMTYIARITIVRGPGNMAATSTATPM